MGKTLPDRIVAWPEKMLMWPIEQTARSLLPEGCGVYISEEAAQAKVIEDAIERLSQKKYEYEMNEETAPTNQDAIQWAGAVLAIDEAIAMLERLRDRTK